MRGGAKCSPGRGTYSHTVHTAARRDGMVGAVLSRRRACFAGSVEERPLVRLRAEPGVKVRERASCLYWG